jgi:SAM-dependent methyltransferase
VNEEQLNPAETYERFFGPAMFEPLAGVLVERAAPRPGERVLDVACGTGIVTRRLPLLVGESGRVVGLDLSPEMLAVARSQPSRDGAPVDWIEGDAQALPLEDGTFDLVVCQQGLQFVPDRAAAAREMRRVLGEDGRAVVAVWQGLDRHPMFRALIEAEAEHLGLPVERLATPFSLGDADRLRALFDGAGFAAVDVSTADISARFAPADRFIRLTVRAAAAVMPELAEGGPEAMEELARAVTGAVEPEAGRYREGDALVFPMVTNVAVAAC